MEPGDWIALFALALSILSLIVTFAVSILMYIVASRRLEVAERASQTANEANEIARRAESRADEAHELASHNNVIAYADALTSLVQMHRSLDPPEVDVIARILHDPECDMLGDFGPEVKEVVEEYYPEPQGPRKTVRRLHGW